MSKVCDNSLLKGKGISIKPQCPHSEATRHVTIRYTKKCKDEVYLCKVCLLFLRRDAKKRGYGVSSVPLTGDSASG